MIAVILLAAGSGQRMKGTVTDKILAPLHGIPAINYSVQAFLDAKFVDRFTIVYRDAEQQSALAYPLREINLQDKPVEWVQGGSERQDSVRHGLLSQTPDCRTVFIHDCARPLISVRALQSLYEVLQSSDAAVLAKPVTDTIKRLPETGGLKDTTAEDLDRSRLWAMETPQAFRYQSIMAAYDHIYAEGLKVTDDTAALAKIGKSITIVPDPDPNPKLTTPEDLEYIEWLLHKQTSQARA
ncbi:2-C-methyl-D-erythritol 4-phosphate cytidylyltransferase [Coraliomargarita parva]|uniref:2-C-methyl-D-erythritol 4-phosphate cytidylyltransferase n=1 Tax=Coraliomargarita parva TaxID=3014050 RepID=UPI0022B3FD99|nr:2-C-methyl-D-erythritol 4-phosphate cytidylyltransferase [Coraliomargarita parva]